MNPKVSTLPRLYIITDPASAHAGSGDIITAVQESARAGARFFQLRDKHADLPTLQKTAHQLARITHNTNTTLLINGHPEIAQTPGFHGIHRPGHALSITDLRRQLGPTAIIGASTHSLTEALQAQQDGATFVTISPVFLSPSKPGYGPALGLQKLRQITHALQIPVYALGGISPQNTSDCLAVGAHGIAVMGGIMAAPNPHHATLQYLHAIHQHR